MTQINLRKPRPHLYDQPHVQQTDTHHYQWSIQEHYPPKLVRAMQNKIGEYTGPDSTMLTPPDAAKLATEWEQYTHNLTTLTDMQAALEIFEDLVEVLGYDPFYSGEPDGVADEQ